MDQIHSNEEGSYRFGNTKRSYLLTKSHVSLFSGRTKHYIFPYSKMVRLEITRSYDRSEGDNSVENFTFMIVHKVDDGPTEGTGVKIRNNPIFKDHSELNKCISAIKELFSLVTDMLLPVFDERPEKFQTIE